MIIKSYFYLDENIFKENSNKIIELFLTGLQNAKKNELK